MSSKARVGRWVADFGALTATVLVAALVLVAMGCAAPQTERAPSVAPGPRPTEAVSAPEALKNDVVAESGGQVEELGRPANDEVTYQIEAPHLEAEVLSAGMGASLAREYAALESPEPHTRCAAARSLREVFSLVGDRDRHESSLVLEASACTHASSRSAAEK